MIFRRQTRSFLSIAAVVLLALPAFAAEVLDQPSDSNSKPDAKEQERQKARFDPVIRDIEGWTVHVDPKLLKGEHAEEGARALTMLANHLQRIATLMPEDRLEKIRKVGIWIEYDHPEINAEPGPYHPAVILHELAHAYHDQVLGFDEPRIKAAYDKAMKAGLYEEVMLYTGRKVRAYAANNHKEYFAEGTEAYFYRNDFYPFVRAELKQHDPVLHDLLEEIWGPMK
jgi:hypothetical protein